VLIRADASVRIGIGHLMRCLALAQAWQEEGNFAHFALVDVLPVLERRLLDGGMDVSRVAASPGSLEDAARTIALAQEMVATWVVLDGYCFDTPYQRAVKEADLRLLVVDDYGHASHYYADLVLNQNISADESLYANRESYTRLLLGPRYAMLRREFWPWRGWQREIPPVAHKVLVTLGGADPDNVTLRVVRALHRVQIPGLAAAVVVGGGNPHWESLRSAVEHSGCEIRLERDVRDMSELMAWADVAISAGGSTCWELAFMGLPALVLVVADNQKGVADGLDALGVVRSLGRCIDVDEVDVARASKVLVTDSAQRGAMSEKGRQLVSGSGADEVVTSMNRLTEPACSENRLRIRPAHLEDAELLWRWANDPVVRANSFNHESISLSDHIEWYRKKLASPDTCIWILELDRVPVGQIRYDRIGLDMADIGFSVVHRYRGRGLGTSALFLSSRLACEKLQVKRLRGIAFSSNNPSARAFTKAGFECVGQEQIHGVHCYVFEKDCV
jgi:UDP-2,4-diacetamido-2,4,6-trideoxy-beta-L-altropyranose hydrolase